MAPLSIQAIMQMLTVSLSKCVILAALTATLHLSAHASDQNQGSVSCPSHVRLESVTLKSTEATEGFSSSTTRTAQRLTGFSLFEGPPEQEGSLKPTRTTQSASGETSYWKFDASAPDGIWMTCDYAQGVVRLATRVSPLASSCEAVAQRRANPTRLEVRFQCR